MTDLSKIIFFRKRLQIEFAKKGIDIFAKSRKGDIIRHRKACIYLLRERSYLYSEIHVITTTDKATINHHYNKHKFEREIYPDTMSAEILTRQIFDIIEQDYENRLK